MPSNRLDTRHHGFPSVSAHDFYESYLKEETTKNDIFKFIIKKIQAHDNAPSQWETDQEFDKNTENYRISVKHRFDSSIITMDGEEEVFPFAPSKKLYQVNEKYVKASCSGTEILYKDINTWVNQKDDEVYYLEGTGEKIIVNIWKNGTNPVIEIRHNGFYGSPVEFEIMDFQPHLTYYGYNSIDNKSYPFTNLTTPIITATLPCTTNLLTSVGIFIRYESSDGWTSYGNKIAENQLGVGVTAGRKGGYDQIIYNWVISSDNLVNQNPNYEYIIKLTSGKLITEQGISSGFTYLKIIDYYGSNNTITVTRTNPNGCVQTSQDDYYLQF